MEGIFDRNYYPTKVQIIDNRWRTELADEVTESTKRGGATYRDQSFVKSEPYQKNLWKYCK